ncbi:putative reverse transcriptase domain-containing protein [Tanacetum coccineum]
MAPGRRPTVHRNPPVNRSTNQNNVDINSGIDTQMLNQLIATRVVEALVAAAATNTASTQGETNPRPNTSQDKTCSYKEFCAFGISNVAEGDRVKFASSTLLDGALTWWNVYVRSVTLDTAHATPWSDFKAMFIRKYCPRNEVKQMENELWNLKVKGTNLTAYNQRLPLNIKGNVTSSKLVDLHEAIEMAQGLMYQVVQELGENSESIDDTTLMHALLLVTIVEGQDIRSKTAELHLVLQAKEDPEAKEDREVMLLISDVAKRDITRTNAQIIEAKVVGTKFEATNKILRTIRGRITETLSEITKHQPALKEDAEHLAKCTIYVQKLP